MHLKERAGDVGHVDLVFLQNAARFGGLRSIKAEDVFVPHAPQLDPLHAKFAGSDFASAAEILAEFIVDNSNPKWRVHTVSPSFSWRYSLLFAPAPFGRSVFLATSSTSTPAQPQQFALCRSSKTAGTSTKPCPSSTKR